MLKTWAKREVIVAGSMQWLPFYVESKQPNDKQPCFEAADDRSIQKKKKERNSNQNSKIIPHYAMKFYRVKITEI